jgi:hypothetical protein
MFPALPVDLMNRPPSARADVQIFTANSLNQNWQTWVKPVGMTMTYMLSIAGGGGGGGGFTRVAGGNGSGGGGGACSGTARLIAPAFFLPNVLYVQVGVGGTGGAASVAGVNGSNSYVSLGHSSAAPNVILASGTNAPGGGGAGSAGAVGAAGSIPTIATNTTAQQIGQWFATVGLIGSTGGSQNGGVGTSVTAWGAIPMSPGAGGGGCTTTNFAGGGQTAAATVDWNVLNFTTTANELAAAGVAGGGIGSPGIMQWTPFFMTGGAGGGTSNTAAAGSGGHGGIGCGGGGGGAGATGGQGGDGGNGMVIIVSW